MIELTAAAQTVEFRLLVLAFLILAGPIIAEKVKALGLIGLCSYTQNLVDGTAEFKRALSRTRSGATT
ncbi:MAG TPA: hypothetical protein VEB69_10170 [Acidimicrobiia bacterium]|nr:hypothetical protein [Acidimicrobiia bacterium]